jgi:hypothetical protein
MWGASDDVCVRLVEKLYHLLSQEAANMVTGDYGVGRALHQAIITCEKWPMKLCEWAEFVRYGPRTHRWAEIPLCFGEKMLRPPIVGHEAFFD